jgi:hypothetical protein
MLPGQTQVIDRLGDVLERVLEDDCVEVGIEATRYSRQGAIQGRRAPGICLIASLPRRLDARHPPAMLAEHKAEITAATANVQQPARRQRRELRKRWAAQAAPVPPPKERRRCCS